MSILSQCYITRSSRPATERPPASDPTVVRLVRLANPVLDTPETVLRCIADGAAGKNEPFLQPLLDFLDQANINYITFASSPGTSALLRRKQNNQSSPPQSQSPQSPTAGAASPSPSRGRDHLMEAAVYAAYPDGACNMTGGALKLRQPLLEQLEKLSGIPFFHHHGSGKPSTHSTSSSSSAAIVQLAVVLALDAVEKKTINVSLQSKVQQQALAQQQKMLAARQQAEAEEQERERRRQERLERHRKRGFNVSSGGSMGGSSSAAATRSTSVTFLDDDARRSSSSQALLLSMSTSALLPSFGGDPLAGTVSDDDDDDKQHEDDHRHKQADSNNDETKTNVLFSLQLDDGGIRGSSTKQQQKMTEARARRLELQRQENIARRERERAERERMARLHAEEYEQQRAERRMQDRDLKHQAELARQRHEAREEELRRKQRLYEDRERDIEAERKEFARRLEETKTLRQIELLKSQGEKSSAAHSLASAANTKQRSLEASKSLFAKHSASTAAVASMLTGEEAEQPESAAVALQMLAGTHQGKARELVSDKVEKDLEAFVQSSMQNVEGYQCLGELEQQRERQRSEIESQARLTGLIENLHVCRAKSSSAVRQRLLGYQETLRQLRSAAGGADVA